MSSLCLWGHIDCSLDWYLQSVPHVMQTWRPSISLNEQEILEGSKSVSLELSVIFGPQVAVLVRYLSLIYIERWHSVFVSSQWELMLQWHFVSHWLNPYPVWSLLSLDICGSITSHDLSMIWNTFPINKTYTLIMMFTAKPKNTVKIYIN